MEQHADSLVTTFSDDERILYFGRWTAVTHEEVIYRRSGTQFNTCVFSFYGPGVKWLGPLNGQQGFADVYLDKEFQCRVDGYGAGDAGSVVRFERDGLSEDRIHILSIVVRKERNRDATGCFQDIERFQSSRPAHYPTEIAAAKETEYARIRSGTKPYPGPETWSPVAYAASSPLDGVTLRSGVLYETFQRNIQYLNMSFALPSYCTAGFRSEPDGGPGWSKWLPASNEGRLLAGAAHSLRWEEHADLRTIVDRIVTDIANRMRSDGYYNYYDERDSYAQLEGLHSERKNYDRVFWTRGLLAAGLIGDPRAYSLLRRMYDWFNASPYLPDMLEGSNATNGLPGGPMMYLSPVGVANDLIVTERYYDQDHWIEALRHRETLCISHYPGERPHCYDLLGLEAFVDQYRATGARKYIEAAIGGWEIYRSSYKHTGGATAICEAAGPYPPKSLYLTTGHNGETCGSVFWININSKLLQLYPTQEVYAREIEEALVNVVAAAQTGSGTIRYHNRLHGAKEEIGGIGNTCCEVSAAGLIGRMPEFIYSVDTEGFYVNLFAASSITHDLGFGSVSLTMTTAFPSTPGVSIEVTTPGEESFVIRVRIPSWATERIVVKVNGAECVTGAPGTYVALRRQWSNHDVIHFTLPIGITTVLYEGLDQVDGNDDRFAVMYGPVLMALCGTLSGPEDVPRIAGTPADLPALLAPVEGSPLEFTVLGQPGYRFVPYWTVDSESFTCFPIVQPL